MDESKVGRTSKVYMPGDFNGDGSVDLFTRNTVLVTPYKLTLYPHNHRHQIRQIFTGLGATIKINYTALTKAYPFGQTNPVYEAGSSTYSYPFIKRPLSLRVVASYTYDNGVSFTGNTVTYKYSGLKYHLHGKGLLGFDKLIQYDQAHALSSQKVFTVNTNYAIPYLTEEFSYQGNYILNRTTYNNAIHHYGNKRIFPYISATEQSDFVQHTYQRKEFQYTAPAGTQPHGYTLGKPNKVITRNGYTLGSAPANPSQLEFTEQTFQYPAIPNTLAPFLRNKPLSVITKNTRTGQSSYTRRNDFTYHPTRGLVTQTVADPGTSNPVTTTYVYNAFGNVTQETQTVSGMASRAKVYEYDPTNRFISRSWNAAYPQVKKTIVYHQVLDQIASVYYPDEYQVSYTYDGLGRVKAKSDNNGASSTFAYESTLPGISYWPPNAVYVHTSVSNDGSFQYDFYDRLGRVVRTATKAINGSAILQDKEYNLKGQLYRKTDPYFANASPQYHTLTYDIRGRLIQRTGPEGDTDYDYLIVGNNLVATFTNPAGQEKKTTVDRSGRMIRSEDYGGILNYIYHSNGEVKQASLSGSGIVAAYEYDAFGRKTKATDPNYGSYEYTYNPYGELMGKKDPKGNQFYYSYNQGGYLFQHGGPEGFFNHYYHFGAGPNNGKRIATIKAGAGGDVINYDYGMGGQLKYEERVTGTDTFRNSYAYNQYGQLYKRIFPNGKEIEYFYSGNGALAGVHNIHPMLGPTLLYMIYAKNKFGQPTSITHGETLFSGYLAAQTTQTYNTLGFLTGQFSAAYSSGAEIRNSTYNFDATTGNLNDRLDNIRNKKESFLFDDLNRLEKSKRENLSPPSMMQDIDLTYADNGNILSKTDAGSFGYDLANRISEIDPYVDVPEVTQNLSYTSFNKVGQIEEGYKAAIFSYWPDEERSKMELKDSGAVKKIKYYASDYEKELIILPGGDTIIRELCYVTDPAGHIMAILERKNGVDKPYYTLTDYLGSITHIIDQDGNLVEERSFDAWGRRRDPDTWVPLPATWGNITEASWDRGYTGHEHLPQFGIINMNGRLYDPIMGRMFSPDPYIIGTDNTQGYNRYTYALNNPLMYNDPNGEHPIIAAVAIGALSGAIMGAYNAHDNGGLWYQGAIWGGGIGALTGLLSSFAPLGTTWVGSTLYAAGLGAVSSGGMAYATGSTWEQTKSAAAMGGITGALAGFIGSEQFGNLAKGQGFKSDDAVLSKFVAAGRQQEALNYFEMDGTYAPWHNDIQGSNGITDPKSAEIFYNSTAFDLNYDKLKMVSSHEQYHGLDIQRLMQTRPNTFEYNMWVNPTETIGKFEWQTYMKNYVNQGLYINSGTDYIGLINKYGLQSGRYYLSNNGGNLFSNKWWHFIYRVPRRW